MTYREVAQMVVSIGLPYAYYQFPEDTPQAPPFICFFYPNSDNMAADNTVYAKIEALDIELYTDSKDFDTEALIESTLAANGLTWEKSETYLDSERMHMTVYEMEVLING